LRRVFGLEVGDMPFEISDIFITAAGIGNNIKRVRAETRNHYVVDDAASGGVKEDRERRSVKREGVNGSRS
jgi:hypothetical protein